MCPHALKHDANAGLWRSERPALSSALLCLPAEKLGVRPPGQPLPLPLRGSLLGRQFERWLRQRDDAGRVLPKTALLKALADVPPSVLAVHAQHQAALALAGGWDHWVWILAAGCMASLLGMAPPHLAAQQRLHGQLQALAQALAAGASPEQVAVADKACAELLQELRAADAAAPLQQALARHAPRALWGDDEESFDANRLGLLWQSYEAGAALLGNALAALAEQSTLRRPGQMRAWLPALVRAGGAVLNTRRFTQAELQLADDAPALPPGSLLLLDLSDAVDDLGFGAGAHRCPGQELALALAAAALEWLLSTRREWPQRRDFLRLPNASIPLFDRPSTREQAQ